MEKLGFPEPAHLSPGAGPVAGVNVAKTAGVEGDEGAGAVSSKLFRSACVRRWLPLVYREELYQVLKLTGPLVSRGKLKYCWVGGGISMLLIRCHNCATFGYTWYSFVTFECALLNMQQCIQLKVRKLMQ